MQFENYLLIESHFENFKKFLNDNHLTIDQILDQIKYIKPDGSGSNANFYKIPNSEFGIRILKHFQNDANPILNIMDDPVEYNIGQPIANYGKNIQIVRLQHGNPAGLNQDLEFYKNQLKLAANNSQKSYNDLLNQIIDLNEKGYAIDPSKSNNLLISNNKFNLVDVQKSDYKNNAGEVIIMLIDNANFYKYFAENKEMQNIAKKIIYKVEVASDATGLSINKNNSVQFSYDLANGKYKIPKMDNKLSKSFIDID